MVPKAIKSAHGQANRVPGARILRILVGRGGQLLPGCRGRASPRASPPPHRRRIVRCETQPTASIVRRADRLRRQVIDHGGLRAQQLHFVGHSTGGLDVRMLLTPGVQIARGNSAERIARAHANRDFSGYAAPRHAARKSLQHRPGPDAAAHCERACHVRAGTRGDCRRGAGGRPRRATRRLDGPLGHGARSHCRRPVAEDPLQPPRSHLEVPREIEMDQGGAAATHARGNEPLRRGRGQPCRHRLWLRCRRRTEAT